MFAPLALRQGMFNRPYAELNLLDASPQDSTNDFVELANTRTDLGGAIIVVFACYNVGADNPLTFDIRAAYKSDFSDEFSLNTGNVNPGSFWNQVFRAPDNLFGRYFRVLIKSGSDDTPSQASMYMYAM